MSYWTNYDDEKLTKLMAQQKRIADAKRAEADEIDQDVAKYQAELDRRYIAALPIKEGDMVLVTEEMREKYGRVWLICKEGEEAIITKIERDREGWLAYGPKLDAVDLQDAVIMRQAWLAREGKKQ